MPELPEVETIRRSLGPLIEGRTLDRVDVRFPVLRWPLEERFADRLSGRRIEAVSRRAKYLIVELEGGLHWHVHFGMSGRLIHEKQAPDPPGKHDHVIFTLDDGCVLVFNDPRRFGFMKLFDAGDQTPFEGVGPEPLDEEGFTADYLFGVGRGTKRSVKDVLMDQRVVAGLGNIYVNESLFLAGIRPRKALRRLTKKQVALLVDSVRTIIAEAIEHRGTTVSDFLDGIGRQGSYQWRRRVYDRGGEPCPACGDEIQCVVVGQRSSFYCRKCQS